MKVQPFSTATRSQLSKDLECQSGQGLKLSPLLSVLLPQRVGAAICFFSSTLLNITQESFVGKRLKNR